MREREAEKGSYQEESSTDPGLLIEDQATLDHRRQLCALLLFREESLQMLTGA